MKITTQFSATISTGEFENEKPLFALEEEFEGSDAEVKNRQAELYNICRGLFSLTRKKSTEKKTEEVKETIRTYPPENYPSVTTIIRLTNPPGRTVPPEQLAQYGARGNIIHKLCEYYAKTNKWGYPKDVDCGEDLAILNNGDLNLSLDGYNLPGFLEKYPIEFLTTETVVKNHVHKYAGRQDGKGVHAGRITLFDYKTGEVDEEKCFKQLSAYWHCEGNEDVERIMVIPLRAAKQVKQGYSKPVICDDKEKYWELFLKDREKFKQQFNI